MREPFSTVALESIFHNLTDDVTIVSTQRSLNLVSRTLVGLLKKGICLPTIVPMCHEFSFRQRPVSPRLGVVEQAQVYVDRSNKAEELFSVYVEDLKT
jgi:hypothetical protein